MCYLPHAYRSTIFLAWNHHCTAGHDRYRNVQCTVCPVVKIAGKRTVGIQNVFENCFICELVFLLVSGLLSLERQVNNTWHKKESPWQHYLLFLYEVKRVIIQVYVMLPLTRNFNIFVPSVNNFLKLFGLVGCRIGITK